MFFLTCTLKGVVFQYLASFIDLRLYLETLLKRSYIVLLEIDGEIDGYFKFSMFDAMRSV